jgi:hypothetical protein
MRLLEDFLYLSDEKLGELVDETIDLVVYFHLLPLEQLLQQLIVLLVELLQTLDHPSVCRLREDCADSQQLASSRHPVLLMVGVRS